MDAFRDAPSGSGPWHGLQVVVGALLMTAACFLVLPVIQAIRKQPEADTRLTRFDTGEIEPPPPPPAPEPDKDEEPEQKPPDLAEPAAPMDLSQLELALNPGGFGTGGAGGSISMQLNTMVAASESTDELFAMADLDQKPRPVFRQNPVIPPGKLRKLNATVYVLCVVDQRGRVQNPTIQNPSDPAIDRPVLAAVKNWRFEPGKRNGNPVRFRTRIPITFQAK